MYIHAPTWGYDELQGRKTLERGLQFEISSTSREVPHQKGYQSSQKFSQTCWAKGHENSPFHWSRFDERKRRQENPEEGTVRNAGAIASSSQEALLDENESS